MLLLPLKRFFKWTAPSSGPSPRQADLARNINIVPLSPSVCVPNLFSFFFTFVVRVLFKPSEKNHSSSTESYSKSTTNKTPLTKNRYHREFKSQTYKRSQVFIVLKLITIPWPWHFDPLRLSLSRFWIRVRLTLSIKVGDPRCFVRSLLPLCQY